VRSAQFPVVRGLTALPWVLLAGCPAVLVLLSHVHPGWGAGWTTISQIVFFAVLLARLVTAFAQQPDRRAATTALTLAMLLFATGSAVVNASGSPNTVHFPAPGELFFLASYAAMAAFLMLDVERVAEVTGVRWLESAVICGGVSCASGSLIVTTASGQLKQDGLSLLLAVLYPLLDAMLAVVVLVQVFVRLRDGRAAIPLIAGFALLAVADVGFLRRIDSGTYDFGNVSIVLWGIGLALVVDNAARRPREREPQPERHGLSIPVVLAGMAAAFVLAFQPEGGIRLYFVVPALITLAVAGARLVLALRSVTRATEAIRLSRSDDLTDLPNRRAVRERLERALRTPDRLGLMLVDLDGFKDINDTLGHQAGDTVLRQIAKRLRAAVAPDVMVARLGGDEFAVVAPTEDEIELVELGQAIHAATNEPLVVDGITVSVGASIGVTARQSTDTSDDELLRRADVAMYEAKRRRLTVAVYDPDADEFSRDRLRLGEELRHGIEDGQVRVWYQPQFDAQAGELFGVEALVRWEHPDRGLLPPGLFLPVARRSGLMQMLSDELARIAVADLDDWHARGIDLRVALNCAPPELMTGRFVDGLVRLLDHAGLRRELVTIEVTEDSFLAEPERAREQMLAIRRHGLQLSVDDYGSGFSSLAYLRDLPIQELKIDRSFITSVADEPRSRMIVASTMQMATALGLRTVAEGVETEAAAEALASLGADVLQGYHLGRPVPPEKLLEIVLASRVRA
jgi:diguanylate cyclase